MWNIPIVEGTASENELSIPVFHIHCLNENISLWTSDAADFMHQIQEEMKVWPDLEFPLFNKATINKEKKIARHDLIQNMWRSLKIKP